MISFYKQCVAEFIGTFFLVFMACGAIILEQTHPEISPLLVPLVFGGVVSVMIYAVGHISGAHFNPAVTLAFSVARHFPLQRVFGYVFCQILGAICASLLHKIIFSDANHNFGATSFDTSVAVAFGFEVIISFLLMFVIISVATDTRAKGEMAGLAIGTTVAICAAFGGPITGASMNPARSLGPAIASSQLDAIWLYLTAPVIGAVLGALAYEKIRCEEKKETPILKKGSGCC